MILTTLALGGALLGATTIAGLLLLYQIRGTTNSENSAKAIFGADSGAEWVLFDFYCSQAALGTRCPGVPPGNYPTSSFSNGVITVMSCYDAANATTTCSSTSTAKTAIARGTALDSSRAFYVDLSSGTSTLP